MFASEEQVSTCVKSFMEFEKKLKADIPKEQRAKAKPTDISGGLLVACFTNYTNLKSDQV